MDTKHCLEKSFLSINLSEYKVYNTFEPFELPTQCEICYSSDNGDLINILNAQFRSIRLSKMLERFQSIREYRLIENSFKLCVMCIKQLIASYLFLEKLKESNQKFKGLVELGNKTRKLYQPVEEKYDIKKIIKKNKNISEEDGSTDDQIVKEENLGNISSCTNEAQDGLSIKHGITHDHSYIQNSDNDIKDSATMPKIKDVVENVGILSRADVQKKKFICHICSTAFVQKQSVDYHIRRIHLNEKTFLCSTCGKRFFLKIDYNRHILLHGGEISYRCELCKKGFVTSGSLKSHKKTVHKAKEIKCLQCSKLFKLQSQLKKHVLGMHSVHQENKSNVLKIQKKIDCGICGKKINKYALKAHIERHSGSKKHQCDICGQKFFQRLSLSNHMIRHRDPKFSCEYCGKPHFTKQEMLTHIRRQHTREIVCSCQYCGKGFVHQTNLIQHIRNCHPANSDDKIVEPKIPKQCTTCGKIYSSRTSLIHHRRRAHENKEYSCTECDLTFRNLVPFKSHLKKIHDIGDSCNCEICKKSFYTREDLYKHKKRTHTTGANSLYLCCTVCKIEKFKTKHELIQHMQGKHLNDSVTSPILYECNICVTFFVNFEIFQKHLSKEHPKTGNERVILEYEIGGCKVQYFNNKRSIGQR